MKTVGAKDGDVEPLGGDVVCQPTLEFGPGGLSALGNLAGCVQFGRDRGIRRRRPSPREAGMKRPFAGVAVKREPRSNATRGGMETTQVFPAVTVLQAQGKCVKVKKIGEDWFDMLVLRDVSGSDLAWT